MIGFVIMSTIAVLVGFVIAGIIWHLFIKKAESMDVKNEEHGIDGSDIVHTGNSGIRYCHGGGRLCDSGNLLRNSTRGNRII